MTAFYKQRVGGIEAIKLFYVMKNIVENNFNLRVISSSQVSPGSLQRPRRDGKIF